jgi:Type III restriction enzyme, res subunit
MDETTLTDLLKKSPEQALLGNREAYKQVVGPRNDAIRKLNSSTIYRLAKDQEDEAGLYPDHFDPRFITHLVNKLEFADTLSKPFDPEVNPCLANEEFETSPVQRFVASFLHPQTPYRGMLLYHGVGVGKTCAAILTAEGYLEQFPYKKIIIIAPRNIQPGFFRTIFDSSRLVIGGDEEQNRVGGCLGDLYLNLTNNLFTRDKAKIERDVLRLIKKRYAFFGYLQFANFIRSITNKIVPTDNKKIDDEKIAAAIRREFNYHMIIIDEAHNLRDIDGVEKEEDIDTVETDITESKAGKMLTPYLTNVLRFAEGIKLMLMTATPMFNNVREIVFLLNRFLINEKREQIKDGEIFDANGDVKPDADVVLGKYASAYISFMRGENPNSFPMRLKPLNHPLFTLQPVANKFLYPSYTPTMITQKRDASMAFANNAEEYERIKGMINLPFYISQLDGFNEKVISTLLGERSVGALNFTNLDALIQAGNIVFPSEDENVDDMDVNDYVGATGFDLTFSKSGGRYKSRPLASWLTQENISKYSPKIASMVGLIQKAKGVVFTYSRFVRTGALFLALVLEANGYTPWQRDSTLLLDGNQSKAGRQCALCSQKERGHSSDHKFVPAKYILLTGDQELSPNNAKSIDAARALENKDGGQIKIVIGSQIAAEGLDLRFVREIHVMDPWFHLNKTEQIIGRGIRFCSHSAIKDNRLHNTTVYLHAVVFKSYKVETADLYSYRIAYKKALQIGKVSRILKEYALDCNLRRPATVINTDAEREVIDSQENNRGMINLSDVAYSPLCDWLATCDIVCKPAINIADLENIDSSTYSQFTARFRESLIKKEIAELFAAQSSYPIQGFEELLSSLTSAPELAISMVLRTVIGNRSYIIKNGSQRGYISIRNSYYVFQPLIYKDRNLPAALRIADLPIKRDSYKPVTIEGDLAPSLEQEAAEAELEVGKAATTVGLRVNLWKIFSDWIGLLATGKLKITDKVTSTIENITDDNLQLRKKYKERLSILVYFFSIDGIDVAIAKKIALEYVWDNFLSLSEQLRLLANPDDTIKNVAKIHMLQSGSIKANRFLNYDSGQIDYICADGRPCSIAVADSFKAAADPLKSLKADTKTTGFFYGFMAAKKGTLVFKTLTPHPVGGVPNRGQECAYDSAPTEKRERLVSLGEFLVKKGLPNLELTDGILKQAPQIKKNASCYCILLELVLRYMDVLQVDKKKWFYRSIESKFAGHKFVALAGKSKVKVAKIAVVPIKNEENTPSTPVAKPLPPPKPLGNEDEDDEDDEDIKPSPTPPTLPKPLGNEDEDDDTSPAEEENNENEIVNLPPVQLPNLNKEKTYKGNWTHEGTVYQRDGLDIFKNGDYVGEYDPTTNTIDTETIFTG